MFNFKTMFMKMFSSHLLILFISFLVFAIAFNSLIHNEMTDRYQKTFSHQEERLIEHVQLAEQEGWDEKTLFTSLEFSMDQENRQILIFDEENTPLFNQRFLDEVEIPSDVIEQVYEGEDISQRVQGSQGGVHYILASPLVLPNDLSSQYAMIMVFHEFDNESNQILWNIVFAVLLTVTITAMVIFFVARKVTKPLHTMTDSVRKFAKGDFTDRIQVDSKDEIGQLGHTFNHMASELGSLEKLRKEFVANVSHDLRSPLTSIQGFLGAMLDGTISPGKQRHYLTIIRNETERLMKLVNDLLDTASIEAGRWKLDKTKYNVTEQIRTTLAKMEPNFSQYNIEFSLNTEEEVDVYADPERMEQVWINVLQNSIHYSEPGDKIEVDIRIDENKAWVKVVDNGAGMSQDELKFIWDRFYKSDKARSKKTGTGIGLSIVKQIVDLHEAEISVNSEKGVGTTLKVGLDLAK